MGVSVKRCTQCKEYFKVGLKTWKIYPFGSFHNESCASKGRKRALKIGVNHVKKLRKKRNSEWGERKEKMLGIRHQEKLTQAVINKYVRERDRFNERGCISCGNPIDYTPRIGGACDAGHYKTQKAHPEIRFNVNNINAECKHCNNFNQDHIISMAVNIARRYGRDRLDWLNSHHKLKKYTIDDHKRIRELARARMKRYLK